MSKRAVRILRSLVKRAAALTSDNTPPVPVPQLTNDGASATPPRAGNLDEQQTIVRILGETNGRVGGANGAAARLGLKRTTLIARMKKLGIAPSRPCCPTPPRWHHDGRKMFDASRHSRVEICP